MVKRSKRGPKQAAPAPRRDAAWIAAMKELDRPRQVALLLDRMVLRLGKFSTETKRWGVGVDRPLTDASLALTQARQQLLALPKPWKAGRRRLQPGQLVQAKAKYRPALREVLSTEDLAEPFKVAEVGKTMISVLVARDGRKIILPRTQLEAVEED